MTEGMPAPFATATDVEQRWRPLTDEETDTVTVDLADASAILRLPIPDIDARIAADATGNLASAAKRVVVDAVLRLRRNPHGAKRIQEQIGDKAYTLDLGDQRSGLFVADDELGPLLPGGGGQGYALGTAIASTRPGWAPIAPRSSGWWPTG